MKPSIAIRILAIVIAVFMILHGISRIVTNGVGGFGEFLDSKHFPVGHLLAWALTVGELLFGLLMIVGLFVEVCCIFFAVELLFGIILVHYQNGWFVVGHTLGGMEYNVLMMVCFVLVLLSWKNVKNGEVISSK